MINKGKRLWDRVAEREALWHQFEQNENIAMFAPRRIGKTHLLKELLPLDAQKSAWRVVFCDLQKSTSIAQAVLTIIEDIQRALSAKQRLFEALKTGVQSKLKQLEQGHVPTSISELMKFSDPENFLDMTLAKLSKDAEQGEPTLLMLDEVTICAQFLFQKKKEEGKAFLNLLRHMRLRYPNIRWLLTGSIGIDHISDEHAVVGTFNDLTPFGIAPLDAAASKAFVDDLCESKPKPFTLTQKAHKRLQQRLGWLSAHYLMRITNLIRISSSNCEKADIDTACDTLLTHPHHQLFKGWPDHIDRNIPKKQQTNYRTLLDQLAEEWCENQSGLTHTTLQMKNATFEKKQLKGYLNRLENDGFITQDSKTKGYVFCMPLLAEYWYKYE